MNRKAELFINYLKEQQMPWFTYEEVGDDIGTVVFRGEMEVNEKLLPMLLLLDESIFSVARIGVYEGRIASTRRPLVERYLGELNSQFKAFKYYILEEEESERIILDMSTPCTPDQFNPELMMYLFGELALSHLTEVLPNILDVVKVKRSPRKTTRKSTK